MLTSIGINSLGNPWSQTYRKKEGYGGKDLQKVACISTT